MTTGIALRPIRPGDHITVQKMFIEFNASEFGKYDHIDHTDEMHVISFLENMMQNHVIYAVTQTGSDEMIGYICFHLAGDEYDIGYMISPQHQGAGIATAASKAAMKRLENERGSKIFTATVAAENYPSVRVLEKLGFTIISENRVKKEVEGATFLVTERRYLKRISESI